MGGAPRAAEVPVAPNNKSFTEPSVVMPKGTLNKVAPGNVVTTEESAAMPKGTLNKVHPVTSSRRARPKPKQVTQEPSVAMTATGPLPGIPKSAVATGESAAMTVTGALHCIPKYASAADVP